MTEVKVNILEPKLSPAAVLAQGGDWQSYSTEYDTLTEQAFHEAARKRQAEEERARIAVIEAAYQRQQKEQLAWNPLQPGVTTICLSCGTEVFIRGDWRDGFDDADPRTPHLFKAAEDGRAILTTPCSGCDKSIAIDLGQVAPSAPRNFLSISALERQFGTATRQKAESAEPHGKPGILSRILGATG
jgi:hypothetical protein